MEISILNNELKDIFSRLDGLIANFDDRFAHIAMALDDDQLAAKGFLTENKKNKYLMRLP